MQNGWIQDGRIQDGRIQDGCHHQINQIELVWVRVRVEWDCFWVHLREENKVSESNMAEFKMAAIIKLSQYEWVKFFNQTWQNSRWLPSSSWVRMNEWSFLIQHGRIQNGCHHQVESEWMSEGFFCAKVGTNPGKREWVWEEKLRWLNPRWQNTRWDNSRWLPSSS